MKRYKWLYVLVFSGYLMGAGVITYACMKVPKKLNMEYVVDINRIMHDVSQRQSIEQLDMTLYPMIHSVNYLDDASAPMHEAEQFYTEDEHIGVTYQPWYQGGKRVGTLKFQYVIQDTSISSLMYTMHGILGLMTIGMLLVLMYLHKQLIRPFVVLNKMPYELSKGHFQETIKVEKNTYLKDFLWGISQLQDTLKVTRKRQLELEKEKKQFLLSLSHDVKTPLNMINLYSKALVEDVYEEEAQRKQAAHQIIEKCKEMEGYIEDIVKQTREDILNLQVEEGEFYLSTLIDKVKHTYEEVCRLRHVDLRIEPYSDCILKGDLHRAQEVMENLFENAFKYGDGEKIHIWFYEEDYCQLIAFHNSGTSIAKQEMMHIFDSFYRGGNAQGIQGYGLGLYICKTIMRKMKGDIFVENSEEGMTFVLVFS